jgi:L-lactate dehydrogenase complex protein LldG
MPDAGFQMLEAGKGRAVYGARISDFAAAGRGADGARIRRKTHSNNEGIMNERHAIFARIREALRVPAVRPGVHGAPHQAPGGAKAGLDRVSPHQEGFESVSPRQPDRNFARWLPRAADGFEERVAAFAAVSQELRTNFRLLASAAEAQAVLASLRDAEGWRRVATHAGPLSQPAAEALDLPGLWTDGGYDKHALEQCDAGLTECDALVAQTGSVLVTSASAGGRALSVLPPHHVVLARREQLVADLPAAFRLLQEKYGTNYPSMISFITGPSRTGDIERILVLGAHGPKKLTVLCW